MMKLRVRVPGSSALKELEIEPEAPWVALLYELEAITGIDVSKMRILCDFPPKPILAHAESFIKDLPLRNNDIIIIQEGEACVQEGVTGKKYVQPAPDRAHLIRRICPADNSCLFHACAYVLRNKSHTDGPFLRQECVEFVLSRPDVCNENTLGMSPEVYASQLRNKDFWGGAIELEILSCIYEVELFALDLQSSTIQKFGTCKDYSVRAFLVYTGTHYDCIVMNPTYSLASEKDHQVLFSTNDINVVKRMQRFVLDEANKLRHGKNTAS